MTQFAKPALSLRLAIFWTAMGVLASGAFAQGLDNPLNRNPQDRSAIPDTAPVTQDVRNSSTRPTLPAAPSQPDPRNADRAPRDPSRFTRIEPVQPVDTAAPWTPAASAASAPLLLPPALPPGS